MSLIGKEDIMKISIFVKTFLWLLISFSLVFLVNMYISYQRFSPMYIEENIENVKSSMLSSVSAIENNQSLEDTDLKDLSSETLFIRFTNNTVVETIGPDYFESSEILDFVINIYDSENSIEDGNLIYHTELINDIYHINYIYQFEQSDYLIISTRIQSLQNVDRVLNNINMTQSIYIMITIILLSMLISVNISRPIKKINLYAKDVSNLKFTKQLTLKRRDEFRELVSSLNEMTFNLKKTYASLNEANQKLAADIDFEKEQEEKKKHLIMTINHEIKTPLAVMKGMIEGMIDGVGRYKDKEKYLAELLTQITTIESITQDLTYSLKLEDKKHNDDSTHTSIIDKQVTVLDEFASQHMIKIQKQIDLCNVNMSEELLIILTTNLVKNAILYSEDKQISVQGNIDNDHYMFTVKNKGQIPEAELSKIFESFYRSSKTNDKTTGTGLGLFIVKQICDLYGYTYKIFNDNQEVIAKVILDIKK